MFKKFKLYMQKDEELDGRISYLSRKMADESVRTIEFDFDDEHGCGIMHINWDYTDNSVKNLKWVHFEDAVIEICKWLN